MNSLRLAFLGTPEISLNGAALAPALPAKGRALLCYLAVERRPASRERLAGLLWSDSPEEDARRSLRVMLTTLHQALPGYLLAERQNVTFNTAGSYWLDVEQFLSGAAATDLTGQYQAVQLYRGDFLSDFPLRGAPLFEEWAAVERERLRQAALAALQRLSAAFAAARQHSQGIECARRWLALEPWQEAGQRQLMRLLAESGQRSAALHQYEVCRQVLAHDLGVEPSPETQALYQALKAAPDAPTQITIPPAQTARPERLAGSAPPPQPTSSHLPNPATPLLGRQNELAQISDLLSDPTCRLITITGPGGIGKTRLAIQAARQVSTSAEHLFTQGIFLAGLESLDQANSLPLALAAALDLSLDGKQEPARQVANHLAERCNWPENGLLILLDNFENLTGEAGWLVELLEAAPGLKLLLTSREALNLYEEWIFPLEGLETPPEEGSAALEEYAAVQLFTQRARRLDLRFSLAAEGSAVARLCRLLEGVPLAIELAAGRVRLQSCDQLYEQIQRSLDSLETALRNIPARHRSLRAVFEYSWALLSEAEQVALARLSTFPGGFSRDAAAAIAGAELRILSALMDKSLLARSTAGRYSLHAQVRQFAAEKLACDETGDSACEKHAAFYTSFLQARLPELRSAGLPAALGAILEEIENVRAAWAWAVGHRHACLLEIGMEGLFYVYFSLGWLVEGESLFAGACAALAGGLPEHNGLWAALRSRQARCLLRMGKLEQAREMAEQSLEVFMPGASPHPQPLSLRERGEKEEAASALLTLGNALRDMGEHPQAAEAYQQSLVLYEQSGDLSGTGSVWNNLGVQAYYTGDYPAASQYLQRCLEVKRKTGEAADVVSTLGNLGLVQIYMGDYASAEACLNESLEQARLIGRRIAYATALHNLGILEIHRGNFPAARQRLTEALELHRGMGIRDQVARILSDLGSASEQDDDLQSAMRYFQEALQHSLALGLKRSVAITRYNLGLTLYRLGEIEQARENYRSALGDALQIDAIPVALDALAGLAAIIHRAGETARAQGYFKLVLSHPQADVETRRGVENLLAELGISKDALLASPLPNPLPDLQTIANEMDKTRF